jgi:hypothetical protein
VPELIETIMVPMEVWYQFFEIKELENMKKISDAIVVANVVEEGCVVEELLGNGVVVEVNKA